MCGFCGDFACTCVAWLADFATRFSWTLGAFGVNFGWGFWHFWLGVLAFLVAVLGLIFCFWIGFFVGEILVRQCFWQCGLG